MAEVRMSVLAALDRWKTEGAISAAQHDAIAALVRKDRWSVFVGLNALLYLGVVALVAGAGWTVTTPGMVRGQGVFYWCSYGLTWILPLGCLRLGIRDRDRAVMDVSIALAIVPLTTNKAYLGWAGNTWDPMVLGIALIGVAVAVRRWIEKGPGGERHGFTLDPDRDAQSLLGVVGVRTAGPGLRRRAAWRRTACSGVRWRPIGRRRRRRHALTCVRCQRWHGHMCSGRTFCSGRPAASVLASA
jgi:hypothetical protein